MTDPAAQVRLAKMLAARPLAFARRKRRAVCLSCSFGQSACAVSAVCSAKQPGIVLFMFKHCFHYHFPIGFVCGSWVRLRKASLFVGFVWLMRNRGPRPVRRPTGDVSIRRVRLAKTGGQLPDRRVSSPTRKIARVLSWQKGPSLARSINSTRVDASARESAEAERYEATPITYELPCSWFVL